MMSVPGIVLGDSGQLRGVAGVDGAAVVRVAGRIPGLILRSEEKSLRCRRALSVVSFKPETRHRPASSEAAACE